MTAIVLPPLKLDFTNASSSRRGAKVDLVVVHRWGDPRATIDGIIAEFKDPKNQASSHGVYAGEIGKDKGRCVQMVALNDKAWTCADFNARSDNWEFADAMWSHQDPFGLARAARIVAWNLWKRGFPPMWVRGHGLIDGHRGFTRHYDLGKAGGGHYDPTTNETDWLHFVYTVKHEYQRGGFRHDWMAFEEV
jgi:hypothetical protein